MQTFKQYYTLEEDRRDFLKSLVGGTAALGLTNPTQAAAAVAKSAGSPWIELKLFTGNGLKPFGATSVNPEKINELIFSGHHTPGLSKSGDLMIDYNSSDLGKMTVYVKPGSSMHAKTQALVKAARPGEHDFSLENKLGDDTQKELGKAIHDTINDFEGSGSTWLEQEIEKEQERYISEFENLPDWQKDERADVDGIDEDSYPAEAQKGATDNANRFIKQGVEHFGAEVGEPIKNVVGRGYMKSYALGAGGGDESTMTDSLVELQDLYGDDVDHPDEDDLYRWLEGEADSPDDTYNDGRADWKDDYKRDMDQVQGTDEPVDHDQAELDHDHAFADDWVTAGFNFLMGASQQQQQIKASNVMNVPGYYQALAKGKAINGSKYNMSAEPNMSEPIQIAYDEQGKEPIEIIGGFEQLAKATQTGEPVYVKMINADELPTDDPKELYREPEPEDTSHYMDSENV